MDAITLQLHSEGALRMLEALELEAITDAQLDDLLAVPGVRATVDNTTKYLPDHTDAAFREAMRRYLETGEEPGHFALDFAHEHAAEARDLVAALTSNPDLVASVVAPLNRYRPRIGSLEVAVHCVVCGVSDGFVQAARPGGLFLALDRAQGDLQGVKLNMTHELYHVVQEAARAREPGLVAATADPDSASPVARLLTTVLDEGTATWVARSMLAGPDGPYLAMWRSAYDKNAAPDAIRANFATLDRILVGLDAGTLDWDGAYGEGFAGTGPPLYFAGFEMARAIEGVHGHDRIGGYFGRHPVAFFDDFLALAPGVLSPESTAVLARAR